jgi:hypothetical protein
MAAKVFLHLGLPKTGTTYLQTVMWADREQMRAQGVLLPGRERRDHLWTTRIIREDPNLPTYEQRVHESWGVLKQEIAAWPGTALISHEFFAGAAPEQAARMVAELAPAEVHLVVTAREPVGLYSGGWQESLKNRDSRTMTEFAEAEVSDNPMSVWNWRTLDVRLVLQRWAPTVPAERVHVLPLPPPGSPRTLLWERFAGLIGLDPASFDLSATFPNESMGVAEAETLRRINDHLKDEDFTARGTGRPTRSSRTAGVGPATPWRTSRPPGTTSSATCVTCWSRRPSSRVAGSTRSPRPRWPRWRPRWRARCCTTYAGSGTTATSCAGSWSRSGPSRRPASGTPSPTGSRGPGGSSAADGAGSAGPAGTPALT